MSDGSPFDNSSNPTSAHVALAMIFGAAMGQAVSIAAELGIADLLADGPKSVEQIAGTTGTDPRALSSIMRTLTSLGVFHETKPGLFSNNDIAETLRLDSPETLSKYAIAANRDCYHRMWSGRTF